MIEIKEVTNKSDLKKFVRFPFNLYKGNPYWVPPIIHDELASFDQNVNPVFKTANATFYLAYIQNKIVGRIVVIVNWDEVNILKKKKVRFGWFEAIDNIEVTKALLEKALEKAKTLNFDNVEGPLGFSNLDKVGILTEGFDKLGNMITWYSMPYYVSHFEKLGFIPEKKYIESEFDFANVDINTVSKASNLIKTRYKVKPLSFTKTIQILPYVNEMFALFNSSYNKLQSFVAIPEEQIEYFKKKYIPFINPEYFKFVLDENNKMIAFAIVMPNFAQALQKANGSLFPFGFYHLLKAKKSSKEAVFYLIGVSPEYQSKGVTVVIFEEYHKTFQKNKIVNCIRTPELEDNIAIHNLWKNFNPRVTKKRSTFITYLKHEN